MSRGGGPAAAALLREGAAALAAAGVEPADWNAERLLRHVLGWDRATLLARPEVAVAGEAARRFRDLVEKRCRRVPLQHLLGVQAFWRHEFLVGPDVLIPRPETELVVETALAALRERRRPLVVDVGTGSGCIALSLAAEREDAVLHATDLSLPALALARENARRLGLAARVAFHHGDLLEPVRDLFGTIDLVASNPPYVDARERESLAPEVRDHEPALALFGSEPPLELFRRLAGQAASALRPNGLLVVEIGIGQEAPVREAFEAAGLRALESRADLQGIVRVVAGRRP